MGKAEAGTKEALIEALIEALGEAISAVTAWDARDFYEHCGYRRVVNCYDKRCKDCYPSARSPDLSLQNHRPSVWIHQPFVKAHRQILPG